MNAKLEVLDRREDVNDVLQWKWPDATGIVTLEGVKVDPQGMLFVAAFNTVTYRTLSPKVVYGNDGYSVQTQAGYIFEVKPTGTDHTITQTLTNTDGFASAIEARTRGGSADLTIPLGPVSGKVGVTGSSTTTDPTNSGSTARSGSNTFTVKVVDGISVNRALNIPSIQSMIDRRVSAFG